MAALKLESMAGFSSTQKALTLMSRTFPIKLISSSFPRFISTISASDASSTLNHRSLPLNEEGLVEDPFWSNPLQPQRCVGCGISFQTEIPKATGFVDKKKMEEFSGGRKKVYPKMKGHWVETSPEGVKVMKEESSKFRIRTKLLLCQRCYRLQFYKKYDFSRLVASDESLPHPFLGETEMAGFVSKILSNIRKDSLVLKMIDILDIESSIVPELFEGCRNRRLQVIWVINKIDCLPKGVDFGEYLKVIFAYKDNLLIKTIKLSTSYGRKVKQWIRRLVRQIKNAHVDDIILLSSLTGLHFEELETSMKRFINIDQPKSIYVVGRVYYLNIAVLEIVKYVSEITF
ncbi:DnaJ domain-containing protein [Cardiosporidium cionae]|uniref:DnaJ domain-containing protein n=1 Tax=Cardiosporidium cionae TaxID=476202 RepID=A0ABQ7J5N8_9APIC|nr:DnaJ domain-containing protein [Cardiosporidium cionae]|eukprot:KAF8819278.1 DnaJ domain-containing protein [Cardiosporidium cionae]